MNQNLMFMIINKVPTASLHYILENYLIVDQVTC